MITLHPSRGEKNIAGLGSYAGGRLSLTQHLSFNGQVSSIFLILSSADIFVCVCVLLAEAIVWHSSERRS